MALIFFAGRFVAGCLGIAALSFGACATSSSDKIVAIEEETTDEAVLLLATERYELHLKDGHVFRIADGRTEEIVEYDEMRELFQRKGIPVLPEQGDAAGMDVLGWRDMECVRKGHACGVEPSFPAHDLVQIRLHVR